MKLDTWNNSIEETLRNAALPPNRAEGQTGFLNYETDGGQADSSIRRHAQANQHSIERAFRPDHRRDPSGDRQ
jgi:hypothetical protein